MSVGVWRFEERVPDARPRFREPAGQRSGYVAVVDAAGRSLRSRPFGRCFARLVIHTFVRPPPQGRSAPRFRLLRSGAPAPRSFNSLSPCSSNLCAMRRSGLVVRCGVDRVTDKYRANRRFFQIPCLFFALRRPVQLPPCSFSPQVRGASRRLAVPCGPAAPVLRRSGYCASKGERSSRASSGIPAERGQKSPCSVSSHHWSGSVSGW